jgi:hypothetical protein
MAGIGSRRCATIAVTIRQLIDVANPSVMQHRLGFYPGHPAELDVGRLITQGRMHEEVNVDSDSVNLWYANVGVDCVGRCHLQ